MFLLLFVTIGWESDYERDEMIILALHVHVTYGGMTKLSILGINPNRFHHKALNPFFFTRKAYHLSDFAQNKNPKYMSASLFFLCKLNKFFFLIITQFVSNLFSLKMAENMANFSSNFHSMSLVCTQFNIPQFLFWSMFIVVFFSQRLCQQLIWRTKIVGNVSLLFILWPQFQLHMTTISIYSNDLYIYHVCFNLDH